MKFLSKSQFVIKIKFKRACMCVCVLTGRNKHVLTVKVLFPRYYPSSEVIDVDYRTIIAVSLCTRVDLDFADLSRNRFSVTVRVISSYTE